jgi:uncharacterized repeat protein (TIGR01451 family)
MMKPFMFTFAKLKPQKFRASSLKVMLQVAMTACVLTLSLGAQAQSAACAANETLQTFNFATPNNWIAGSSTINYTIGTGASSINVSGVATMANVIANYPVTEATGGFASSYAYSVDRPNITDTNSVVFTFSKPINKLQLVVTDLDYFAVGGVGGGAYQDRVTITGSGSSGAVTPTGVAASALVTIAGNVATSASTDGNQNCPLTGAGSNQCNATFSFAAPITTLTYAYGNGPGAFGNPPNQLVGLAALGFCVQNPDLSLVKAATTTFTAGGTGTYSFAVSNGGSAATTGTTTVKDILPAGLSFGTPLTTGGANSSAWTCVRSTTTNANDTATCTSTTAIAAAGSSVFTLPVTVAGNVGGSILNNKAKVFGGGDPNKAAETTTGAITACASDGLAGSVANAGCGFEATPILSAASVVITKTDGKSLATSGGTNAYVVGLTNQGPSVANGVVVTDVVGAGLTCPPANAVTCTVTGVGALCPAGPLTVANLTGAGITVATLPVNGALQFAYSCNVN